MSIYITKERKLIDSDFFGKTKKIKVPNTCQSKKQENTFKECFTSIKHSIEANGATDITSKKLKEVLWLYYSASPQQRNSIIKEGITKQDIIEKHDATLFQILKSYKENILAHSTTKTKNLNIGYIETWELYINIHSLKQLLTTDLTPSQVNHWQSWRYHFQKPNSNRIGEISDAVINKEFGQLKKCFEWAYQEDLIEQLPKIFQTNYKLQNRGNRKGIEPLTIDEQKELLEHYHSQNPFYHDSFLFFLITGVRLSEIDNLTSKSLNIEEGVLSIHQLSIGNSISNGKTASAPRRISTCQTLIDIFSRGHILNDTRYYTDKFNVKKVKKLNGKRSVRIQSEVSRLKSNNSNFSKFNIHRLRHSCITNQLQAGIEPLTVSRQAGHKNISITTDRYGKYATVGFSKQAKIFADHLQWLQKDYFKTQNA